MFAVEEIMIPARPAWRDLPALTVRLSCDVALVGHLPLAIQAIMESSQEVHLPGVAASFARAGAVDALPACSMHRTFIMMMNTVRDTFHTIGDRSGDIARTIGSGTVDVAKRFGSGTADLATRIGTKRALIGLAVLAAAIGGSVLVIRYLRARDAKDELGMDESGEGSSSGRGRKSRNRSNAAHADSLSSH